MILTAGLVVGVLDISSAFVMCWQRGVGAAADCRGSPLDCWARTLSTADW